MEQIIKEYYLKVTYTGDPAPEIAGNVRTTISAGVIAAFSGWPGNHAVNVEELEWTPIEKGLPEVGAALLIRTEYLTLGKLTSDLFAGYLGEDGECMMLPTDEEYGWNFEECVTHWMPIPNVPNPNK